MKLAEDRDVNVARDKLWNLVEKFHATILVTRGQDGRLSGRPMTPLVRRNDGVIYVLAEQATEGVRAIEHDPTALLTFADGKRYVSISVRATISKDRRLIEDLWNPGAQAFWPQGPSQPDICALVLQPLIGEYWDGDNSISAVVQMLVANVTGKQPDLGDHGEVRL